MNSSLLLRITSLLTLLLMSLHLVDDYVRGYDKLQVQGFLTAVGIFFVWLYGATALADGRIGKVIMLLGGALAVGIPLIHLGGTRTAEEFGFFFLWTMLVGSVLGLFSIVLSILGLAKRA